MKLNEMKEVDFKKIKSCLYKLIDNELKLYNFKFCYDIERFYELIKIAHESICSLVIGFLFCYKLYVDFTFGDHEGISLASDIEKDLVDKYFEEWNNDKTRKR